MVFLTVLLWRSDPNSLRLIFSLEVEGPAQNQVELFLIRGRCLLDDEPKSTNEGGGPRGIGSRRAARPVGLLCFTSVVVVVVRFARWYLSVRSERSQCEPFFLLCVVIGLTDTTSLVAQNQSTLMYS